ncbi:MAG: segregation and condensation protein A [Candidatus Binatia bacterium]
MTPMVDYTVKLDAFEGPLDLLLHLVKANELDIYHLPVATITDQYLAYIQMFEELNLDMAGEYLVMAATLVHLKSRLLLPHDDEDEESEDDPAAELVQQLAEYSRYREAAEALRDRALLDRDVFKRPPSPPEKPDDEEAGFSKVELPDLFEALRRVLQRAAARRPHEVEGEEYHVADAVRGMMARLRSSGSLHFRDLFPQGVARGYIIASFIGLLELMKMGIVEGWQDRQSGEITMRLLDHENEDKLYALLGTYGPGSVSAREGRGGDSLALEESNE